MDCATNISDLADSLLIDMFEEFSSTDKAQKVNFRELVSWVSYGERASHMIHLYPAKLLPHIPAFFLANTILSKEGDLVLDPFCGSGTTLLEAAMAKRKVIGSDSNPLARLISEVKITPISNRRLINAFTKLRVSIEGLSEQDKIMVPDVINIDHWFYPHVKKDLAKIKYCIENIKNREIKAFFKLSFSNTVKRVSLADPKLSVPVRLNANKYEKSSTQYKETKKQITKIKRINVFSVFQKVTEANITRISNLHKLLGNIQERPKIYDNAKNLCATPYQVEKESVQLIITSPPYGGAQKYIRSSCLNMGWLNQCKSNELRKYEKQNIGREHYSKSEYKSLLKTGVNSADAILTKINNINPLRAHIASNYLLEMDLSFKQLFESLKTGGYLVLVIGNNCVCGFEFETKEYLKDLLLKKGLKLKLELVDDIHSRGLMTKRNKTASIIASESVLIFRKGHHDH